MAGPENVNFMDVRKLKTRDILLRIIRQPYDEDFGFIVEKGKGLNRISRIRTCLSREKTRLAGLGKKPKPLTIVVVSVIEDECCDKLILRTQKHRGRNMDQRVHEVEELLAEIPFNPAQYPPKIESANKYEKNFQSHSGSASFLFLMLTRLRQAFRVIYRELC